MSLVLALPGTPAVQMLSQFLALFGESWEARYIIGVEEMTALLIAAPSENLTTVVIRLQDINRSTGLHDSEKLLWIAKSSLSIRKLSSLNRSERLISY
jgi:hypothetical protein